jgi:CBS domain-containing membrane protein
MTHSRPVSEIRVRDLMSSELTTLSPGQSLPLAERLMELGRFRHLPVVDGDVRLVGLVTHRDLLSAKISALDPRSDDERSDEELSVPVSRIMQKDVWTVTGDTLAVNAARTLQDHHFGCLPVVDRGRLVGIVTEADFLSLATEAVELGAPRPIPTVHQAMSRFPVTLEPASTVGEARQLMEDHGVRHLPVVDHHDRPVAILSDRDLRMVEAAVGGRESAREVAISLVGTETPYRVHQTAHLGPVLLDLAAQQIGSALVVDDDQEMVGILTMTDACRLYGQELQTRASRRPAE